MKCIRIFQGNPRCLAIVLLAGAALIGCGRSSEPSQTGSARQPIETCNEDSISWAPSLTDAQRVCAGPIEYTRWCYNLRADSACPVDHYEPGQCDEAYSCQDPAVCGVSDTDYENVVFHPVINGSSAQYIWPGHQDLEHVCSFVCPAAGAEGDPDPDCSRDSD